MDLTTADLGTLLVLALVDSTSIGTLIVPIWLLLVPGPTRIVRLVVYLATVAGFYLAVGVLLLAGVDGVASVVGALGDQRWLRWAQLVVGAGMLAWGVLTTPRRSSGEPGRLRRWRERLTTDGSVRGLVVLALTVTVLELAMMLPYLAAIGLVASSGAPWAARGAVLAGYCLVMVLPALLLTAVRVAAGARIEGLLRRVDAWITRNAAEATAWTVGLIGFFLAADAWSTLSG